MRPSASCIQSAILRRSLRVPWLSCLFAFVTLCAVGVSPVYAQDTITGSDRLEPLNIPANGPAFVSGVIGDPTDPATLDSSPVPPDIVFEITPTRDDGVSATSSNTAVVPNEVANLRIFKFDASDRWGLTITPIAPGETTITVQAGTAAYVIEYAASAAAESPTTARFHTGSQEASSAIGVDLAAFDGMWVADDEDNVLRLYKRNRSGLPVESFDFTAQLGFDQADRVMDLEASTRAGNTIYWLSSHSNTSSGNERAWRKRLFSTMLSDDGYTLTFGSYDDGLREDLKTWDEGNNNVLGLSSSMVGSPEDIDSFNIEGLAMVPGSTSAAFIGFRAPLVPPDARTNALVVPLNNIDTFVTGSNPEFGDPILLDLDGNGIRSMECNASECLIIAGKSEDGGDFHLYRWSGNPDDNTPELLATDLSALGTTGGFEVNQGSFESIVEVPNPLPVDVASPIQLLLDNGNTRFYPNGLPYADLNVNWRKFHSEQVLLVSQQPGNQPPSFTSNPVASAKVGAVYTYDVVADDPDNDDLSFALASGPEWLTLTPVGPGKSTLSGTPSTAGDYDVEISVTDNVNGAVLQSFTLVVSPAEDLSVTIVQQRVTQSSDDAEELLATDPVYLDSTDLEFTADLNRPQADQTVGIRFRGLDIPRGAMITRAYIEFTTNEASSDPTSLQIDGEAADDSITFTTAPANISQRSRTTAFQPWDNLAPWAEVGTLTQTPELKAIVQEIVDRENWAPGNALTFIITGIGRRVATSFDGNPAEAPKLYIEYVANQGSLYLPVIMGKDTTVPVVESSPLVANDAVWSYWDAGTAPDPQWQQVADFDDSGWKRGAAPLGYGNGDEATQLDFGGDENDKHITYYFRHAFTVEVPTEFQALDLQLLRDDGAIVYLNGQEVARSNMPDGASNPDTLALRAAIENQIYQYTIDPDLLIAGRNVIAVELHQASATSSDVTFALTLRVTLRSVVRFAVIGDYGADGPAEAAVATRLKSWHPEFVITLGDNNYDSGAEATIENNIFKHYGEFITDDATTTRFFPSLGNHDWYTAGALPYFAHFVLPGNERYYDFVRGDVHFFVINSDPPSEPDGVTADSVQAHWLRDGLAASKATWKIVYFHHPPYSSGFHGSSTFMQWPFALWGADVVLAGHEHNYERLVVGGMPYFVNGLGGKTKRDCTVPTPVDLQDKSRICYDNDYGAMLVEASAESMSFKFIAQDAALIDSCTLPGTCD